MKVKNPRFANAEQTLIDCEIEHPVYGWIPFTANPNDVEPLGRDVFAALISGAAGPISPYVAPVASADDNKFEAERRLQVTDWVNQPDVYDSANTPHLTNRDAFLAYRSQIRAIAVTPVDGNLEWPVEPAAIWSHA